MYGENFVFRNLNIHVGWYGYSMKIAFILLSLMFISLPVMADSIQSQSTICLHSEHGISETPSDWLLLVYMDADNSLGTSGAVDTNLRQLMAVGSDETVRIVVLLDRNGFGDAGVYLIQHNNMVRDNDTGNLIPSSNEINMGDGATLRAFLNYSTKFGRNHTFLVLWDHGSGWKGFCTDSQSKDSLSLSEIKGALEGFDIDVLGIDACEGALVEVVYELRNSAKYFVGSQKDEPESGWNYTVLLNMAKNESTLSPENFARAAVESFRTAYQKNPALSVSVALSAINLTRAQYLFNALNNFSAALKTAVPLLHFELSTARNSTESYEGDSSSDIDLGDFAKKCQGSSYIEIRVHANEVLSLLRSCVIDTAGITAFIPANGVRADNVTGLSIYFPKTNFNIAYANTRFALENRWDDFVMEFLSPTAIPNATLVVSCVVSQSSNQTYKINVTNPENAMVYICNNSGLLIYASNNSSFEYFIEVPDYYEVLVYNFTAVNGYTYLNGFSKIFNDWIGETKPNLRIKDIQFYREDNVPILGQTGKHPVHNRTFTMDMSMENTGNVNLSFSIEICVDSDIYREQVALGVNESARMIKKIKLSSGFHEIRVTLDPENKIRETNETDNSCIQKFTVLEATPRSGIILNIQSNQPGNFKIYNETGFLIADEKLKDNTQVYVNYVHFYEGEYLYLHIYTERHTMFKKIQVFSEDHSYNVVLEFTDTEYTSVDYVFLISAVILLILIFLFVALLVSKNIRR